MSLPSSSPAERAPRGTTLALFLASIAILALEIAQVRIFSYSIDPLLVFSAISVALLGLGAGGIAVALRPSLAQGEVRGRLAGTLALFSAGVLAAHAVFARASHRITFGTTAGMLTAALPLLALLMAPYFFGGIFLTVVFTRHVRDVGRVYFWNLAGSALGCVVVYPLLRPFGVEPVVALLAALGGWCAVLLARGAGRGVKGASLAVALAATASVPLASRLFPFQPDPSDLYGMARAALRLRYPGRAASEYEPVREFAQWDPVSRAEVYAFPGEFGRINGEAPMRLFAQDGGAGSILVDLRNSEALRRSFFEATIWAGPYYVRPRPARVLVIGLGGGPDILTALHQGAGHVTGVEINASTLDVVRHAYAGFLGAPYARPNVEVVHCDGRSFAERATGRYDVIQMTGADTYSAGAAGAFMFSESYLYTLEAFERYIRLLDDDGVLSITRFGPEAMRVISSEVAAMRRLGIAHPEEHLIVLGQGISVNILLSRRPLSRVETAQVVRAVTTAAGSTVRIRIPVYEAMGFGIADPVTVLYAPGFPMANQYADLVRASAAGRDAELLARLPLDFTPVTDDRPFFFQFLRLGQLGAPAGEATYYGRGFRAHLVFLGAIAAIATLLVLLPAVVLRRRRIPAGAALVALGYFGSLGLGYLFVELTLMQKSALFLGHPTYSVAVTLLTLLLASGLGSAWAARLGFAPRRAARVAALAVVALLALAQLTLHPLFVALLPLPFLVRALVLAAVTFPLGFAMGIPFPSGLRLAAAKGETLVAWALGVNSFASVIASLLAVPLAMVTGFSGVVALALGLYAVAVLATPKEAGGE